MNKKLKEISNKQVFDFIEHEKTFLPDLLPLKVKALRKALGLTQAQMAVRLGMSQPAYLLVEKKLDYSGIRTIERFLKELNCALRIQIVPKISFKKLLRERAYKKAKALLSRTYGNMALEKQSPDKKTYEKRLKELAEELAAYPKPSLWED